MMRWLRTVLPPGWVLVLAVLFYAVTEFLDLLFEWYSRQPLFSTRGLAVEQKASIYLAPVYGLYRVWAFHPVLRPAYSAWLRSTPWTSRKPLPFGPVELVWQDVLLVGVLLVLHWPRMEMQSLYVLQAFFIAYLVALASVEMLTGQKRWAYAIGFGIGVMIFFWFHAGLCLAAAGATYVIGLIGLRRSLAAFPWEDSVLTKKWQQGLSPIIFRQGMLAARGNQESLGWPYARLGPEFTGRPKVSVSDAVLLALLAGWWFYALFDLVSSLSKVGVRSGPEAAHGFALLIYSFVVFLGLIGRILLYCSGYAPPITLLGRLAHGRLIIPDYDRVFVAPLLVVLIAVVAVYLVFLTHMHAGIVFSTTLALNVFVLLGVGPGLDTWRLTGNHRIVPFGLNTGTNVRV